MEAPQAPLVVPGAPQTPFGSALAHGGSGVASTEQPQPSPTGPLQSPALRCLLEKHFSGWFPCLSPAVFVFDGTDCFQLADFVSCSVAGALTLGVTTGGEGTFLSWALPFLLSSAC